MWSSTRTVAATPNSAIVQLHILNNFTIEGTHMQMIQDNQFDGQIRSDPHRNIIDFLEISNIFQYGENQEEAVRIFLYNTPNEAFKILEDKVLLKLNFPDGSQNPKPKTAVSADGISIDPDHVILMEKFEALATKIDSEFLKIRK
ncbi:hypothetical protein Tco_1262700 [Tanacetum coccineum]